MCAGSLACFDDEAPMRGLKRLIVVGRESHGFKCALSCSPWQEAENAVGHRFGSKMKVSLSEGLVVVVIVTSFWQYGGSFDTWMLM